MNRYDNLNGTFPVFDFTDFIPDSTRVFPNNRISDFITTGPFVLKTSGSFESEHMYEREKILLEDYLASDGGEKDIAPVEGDKVTNKYYGDEYLFWKKGFIKWDCLRFDDKEDSACDPALFATEQRNAVYYAAFYVRCEKEEPAVICYCNSGSTLFVNGEQVDFKPYGRVKGVWTLGYQCPVIFRKGLNLVLFKIRPGYIADSMDISMSNCSIFPVILKDGNLGITSPSITKAYTGSKDAEKQLFPFFAAAFGDTKEADVIYEGEKIHIPSMKKGDVSVFRFAVPSGKEKAVKNYKVSLNKSQADYYFPATPYDGFEGTEHVMSDFHFDTTYNQEQRTYALGAFHITKCIVEKLMENPDFKATLSEIDYLHPFYTLYPQYRKTIEDAFSTGRGEADCFFNQPNDLTSSGEAFIRNLIYGQLYHRDVLGRISTVYAPQDVFGHFSQMTQVCAKGGCDYIKWSKMMLGTDQLFRHVSPDGTSLIHDKGISRQDALRFGVKGCDFSSGALSYMEAAPRDKDTSWMKDTVSNISFSVFSDLAKDINESAETQQKNNELSNIEYSSRDLTQHHSGVLLTRTDFKQANRLSENLLITAEKFSAIAFMYGAEYPDKALDKATRQLLCAQHHDSVTGTNNEISFIDLMIQYREIISLCSDIIEKACRFIASGVKLGKRDECIFVFNPLTWERSGKCRFILPEGFPENSGAVLTDIRGKEYPAVIEDGKGWFIASSLPAMGYSVFRIREAENQFAAIKGNDTYIENKKFRLCIDTSKGGTITSIYDKEEKKELINQNAPSPANTVYVLKEIHDRMETQHELYTTGHKLLSSDYEAVSVSEKCYLYEKLTVRVKLDTVASLTEEITLYRNSDTIDFVTSVEDYQGEDDLFTVAFPMNIKGGAVVYDDRGTPHVSTKSKKYMSFQTHQYASFSGCRILPAGEWFGIGPSVKLNLNNQGFINFGMTAIIRKKEKGLSDTADRILFALTKKAVPVTLYPDCEQHGGHKIIHFNEDVYSTDTRIVIARENDGNLYIKKLLSDLKASSLKRIKKALSENGIAYIYIKDKDNIYKKNIDVLAVIGKNDNNLSDFASELSEQLKESYIYAPKNVICISEPDYADDYGCALINSGTVSSSVEGENTLNMMLFHTASFYGNMGMVTGGRELVPEQKTHIFRYELYPHKYSFRESEVYKKSYEFNNQPFAFSNTEEGKNTVLPDEKAFLQAPPRFPITAFKAASFPYANLKAVPADPVQRGFCIRGTDTEGTDSSTDIITGFPVRSAVSTDLLEENGIPLRISENRITLNTPSHSIETVVFKTFPQEKAGTGLIGKDTEAVPEIYIRTWEHDMGSTAMGNLGFAATVEKLPRKEGTKETIYINVVNNLKNESQDKNIAIECSQGITSDKDYVSVNLKPGEWAKIPVDITLDRPDREGQIKIRYTFDGMSFYDVYEFGYFNPSVCVKINNGSIVCTVNNPSDQKLEGGLYIASPFETWGSVVGEDCSLGLISPDCCQVVLEPYETKEYTFSCILRKDIEASFWVAAKLCVNGRIHFAFDRKTGPRHNIWAHVFYSEIEKDNGSIKKILEM